MNNGKICIPVCVSKPEQIVSVANSASRFADVVELRLDCLEEVPSDLSSFGFSSEVIATLRPTEHGGNKNINLSERLKFWKDLRVNWGADVEPDVIESVDANISPKICSYHDFTGSVRDLEGVFRRLSSTSANVVKIAITAEDSVDSIEIWKLLQRAKYEDRQIIAIAMGEAGKWTRILGLAHGAYLTYASLETGNETAPGQIKVRDMIDVYRVKELDDETEVYGIIAGDTTYTMSPYIHNAAFRANGMNKVFVPFQVADLDAFITRMVRRESREIDLNLKGFSVTNPHKQAIIKYLDHVDEAGLKIGAVNTIKIVEGKLLGFNTDAHGFITTLVDEYGELKGVNAAVAGAGGAARSCIHTLIVEGANVTSIARNVDRARKLVKYFDIDIEELDGAAFSKFDIVVNATPLGTRGDDINESIATAEQLRGVKLVYDLVYNPTETRLLHEAKKAGAKTIGGFEMLIAQAIKQFEIWTGQDAPVDEMSAAAKKRLYDN